MPNSHCTVLTLLELARREFAPRPLSEAERDLFTTAETGKVMLAPRGDKTEGDAANVPARQDDRVIHAECLVWLCTNRGASLMVTYGGIRMDGVRIKGDLNLENAQIAFPFSGTKCAFEGRILLSNARMRSLSLLNCSVNGLEGGGVNIEGNVLLRGSTAKGGVNFAAATIGGRLDCGQARFTVPNGYALTATNVTINGSVFLTEGCRANGGVNLDSAKIGGDLDCSDFTAWGHVNLAATRIGGDLVCYRARFTDLRDEALRVDRAKIEGSVFLSDGFKAVGWVRFWGADIAVAFFWSGIRLNHKFGLDLRSAKVGTLWDNKDSWPRKKRLLLDGFRYDRIHHSAPTDATSRIEWLHLQPEDRFLPQPYEQLAAVFRDLGQEANTRRVLFRRSQENARSTHFLDHSWWWYNFFGRAIGYGYVPSRPLLISLLMILFGSILFGLGYSRDLISPTNEIGYVKDAAGRPLLKDSKHLFSENYPNFNPIAYSLESFAPLVKLDMSAHWRPDAHRSTQLNFKNFHPVISGQMLQWYLWFHIMAGWILTSWWVGLLTGIVKS
ncbi:MAG: hypothetical protein V7609_3388 [Verrucomicrobiota bacterium]